jgi:HD domain
MLDLRVRAGERTPRTTGSRQATTEGRSRVRSDGEANPVGQLAQVTTATLLVAGTPVAVVWWLRASGAMSSAVLSVLVGMALSLGASWLGCLVWEKRSGSSDLLFSELMIWGYLHRRRTQRRLASALDMLGPIGDPRRSRLDGMSAKDQAKLLERLVAGVETSDPYLHGHSRRVARHSWMIARRMGLPAAEVARIRTAAAIHDVGKVKTPKSILHKPGALTDGEYDVVKRHPGDGASMAQVLRDERLAAMVRHHHERLDGSGYPDGLAGQQIPLGARIIAVADTFDAITSARPYRAASPHKKAFDILREEAGSRLDPAAVRAFCGHYAGRRPLAVWSFAASLPERVVSWLAGSLASVASVAKVVAIAALVGSAAATTSTLATPVPKPHRAGARTASAGLQAQSVYEAPGRGLVLPATAAPQRGAAPRQGHGGALGHGGGQGAAAPSSPVAGGGAGGGEGSGGGALGGHGPDAGEASGSGGSREGPGTGGGEAPGKGGGEAPGKGGGETPGKGGGEGSGKGGEGSGKGGEGSGKSEGSHGKSEESHGQGGEGAGGGGEGSGKSGEGSGKSEEAHGSSGGGVSGKSESHGKSEESSGKGKGAQAPSE